MLSFGAANGHGNEYQWAEIDDGWDAFTSYSTAMFAKLPTDPGAGTEYIWWGKHTGVLGWELTLVAGTPNTLRVYHDGATSDSANAAWDPSASVFSFIAVWTGAVFNLYKDNGFISGNAFAGAISNHASALRLSRPGGNGRVANDSGQLMIWRNYQLTAQDRTDYHGGAGGLPPSYSNLVFWVRGKVEPPVDAIKSVTGTETGAVVLVAHASDDYWTPSGGFVMFVAEVLTPIFGATLARHASLFGPGAFREAAKALPLLNRRCLLDWMPGEPEALVRHWQSRPIYGV